jgi:hypothetical protein
MLSPGHSPISILTSRLPSSASALSCPTTSLWLTWHVGSQSNTPLHFLLVSFFEVEVEVNSRPTVSRSVGQSASLSWWESHLCPMTRFLLSLWRLPVSWYEAPSLTRGWVCNLLVQLLLGLARVVTLGSKSRRTHGHILLYHLWLPNLKGQVPVFIFPRNRVAPLHPRALGSLFVASYDSRGYGGGVLSRQHMGIFFTSKIDPFPSLISSYSRTVLVRSMVVWESAISFCPTSEPMGTEAHSSISFLLPVPASRLFRFPPALALVSCSPYLKSLNMVATYSSETPVYFQRYARRYIAVELTSQFDDE